jgi:hypothetical protein
MDKGFGACSFVHFGELPIKIHHKRFFWMSQYWYLSIWKKDMVPNDVLSFLYWVYKELQIELQNGSNVKILLFLATLSATVCCCRICTKSVYSTSSHQAEKIDMSTSKLKFSGLLPLAQPD